MEALLEWARGPAFLFALSFMILGLARHVVLTLIAVRRVLKRAGDKHMPYAQLALSTLKWLFPITKLGNRFLFGITTLLFHIAVIIVPILLAGHIVLWKRGLGISWPAISSQTADILTVIAVATAMALVIQRVAARDTRSLSRFQDYAIPLLVALPFATGFLAMHPELNPLPYQATMLAHVLSANLLMALIPVTKLSHISLVPAVHLVSEAAWHWPHDSGSKVATALHKEGEPV